MGPIFMALLLVAALGGFAYVMWERLSPLTKAKPDSTRTGGWFGRAKDLFVYGFAQKRMIDDPLPGLLHIFIFVGFMVVSLRTATMVGMGFSKSFHLPFLGAEEPVGIGYLWVKDVVNGLILVGCAGNLWRRLVTKPQRLSLKAEGWLILLWISALVLTDLGFDGALLKRDLVNTHPPVVSLVAAAMRPVADPVTHVIGTASYWIHVSLILGFLVYLPHGKHFHVILSLPNILLRRSTPKGRLAPVKLDVEGDNVKFGTDTIGDLTWKQMLDTYTCTECGRCTNACPAFNSGKPLSPKHISVQLRDTVKKHDFAQKLPGGVIDTESLWSCTTCRACEEMCPVFIEYVDRIVDMRRELVLMEGSFPQEMQTAFTGIERNGNPWNFAADDRMAWAEGLGVKTMASVEEKGESIDYLFWVGCSGSFDDRNKKVSRALVKILNEAGIKFAILGKEETCTGDPARRAGNEYLAQAQITANVATFEKYKGKIKKVVTACPHCFNTLANEYPDFGLKEIEVVHHSMLLQDLLASGRLKVPAGEVAAAVAGNSFGKEGNGKANGLTVFHDPCYLGRYNDQYDAPRGVLDAIPGMQRVDVDQSKRFGRCCGAGGARMFMEEKVGIRMNENRLADLKAANPDTIAVGCPFCMTMINDAVNQTTPEGAPKIVVKDLSEVLADRLKA